LHPFTRVPKTHPLETPFLGRPWSGHPQRARISTVSIKAKKRDHRFNARAPSGRTKLSQLDLSVEPAEEQTLRPLAAWAGGPGTPDVDDILQRGNETVRATAGVGLRQADVVAQHFSAVLCA
jgi:hypothetical protein